MVVRELGKLQKCRISLQYVILAYNMALVVG